MIGWFRRAPRRRIHLYNTASKKKELFEPLACGMVKVYSCGPTVYNYIHIGNLRAFLLSDVLRRVFEYAEYRVLQVMNITDFGHLASDADAGEDKMMTGLRREGLEPTMHNMFLLASKFVDAFREDLRSMNILTPHVLPRASEHVQGMIAYVDVLLHKGYAYRLSDGIYFDTARFPKYGMLGGSASLEHSRTGVSGDKRDPRDFALWKFSSDPNMGWEAPWGRGFPGWHTECTAMATRYLGKSFDIHTGGVDHIAVHHNNELAQAEAANQKPYARYWLHNEFITIDGTKLSKSLGNEITLRQLRERGISPLAYRYWLLTGHYRQSMNFSWEAVSAAQTALFRALKLFTDLRGDGTANQEYLARFEDAIFDDLGTPQAIAILWEVLKDALLQPRDKRATILAMDQVLAIGFSLTDGERRALEGESAPPAVVSALVADRERFRAIKNFTAADATREQIRSHGYEVLDTDEGPVVRPIHATLD